MYPLDLLIIEDNPADLEIIRRYLQEINSWDFDIRCSRDYYEAKRMLEAYPPDLIILDQKLPDKTGLQLLKELQTQDSYIPVIMLTGAGTEAFVSRAIRQGVDDYIAKADLSIKMLENSIKHVMDELYEKTKQNLKLLSLEQKNRPTTDELTGLYSRSALVNRINREINLDNGAGGPLSLLFIDLDNFKKVNDRKGHVIGDKLLRRVAEELVSSVREQDFVARYGGDEFCVLLPGTGADGAEILARKIVSLLEKLFQDWLSRQQMVEELSVSIGLTELTDSTDSVESLIESADRAMYRAKENGGGCIASI